MLKSLVVVAALAVLGSLGFVAYRHAGTVEAAVPAGRAAVPPVPVTAGTAESRDMPVFVRGIGTVQAYNTVAIKSRVDGNIVKVNFTEGQEVKEGDPLFQIDPRPFEAALSQAAANKERDEALLVSAAADLKRYTELVGNGFQTKQAYDNQKALVGQLQAAIKADQAQIEAAKLNLVYADIRSPIEGRTGARLVDIGNLVHANDNAALVVVTQLRPIFVSFTLPQNTLDAIRQSQTRGELQVHAYSDGERRQIAAGTLTLLDNQIDQATGTLHLKGTFENRDEALWPGEFVNMRVVIGTRKNAVTVPARTVQRGVDGDYLYVIKPDMTVEMRTVEVAQVEEGIAVIGKGLTAGERVVVDGQYRLEKGHRVTIQEPDQGPAAPDVQALSTRDG